MNIDFDRCEADFSWGCGDGFDFNSDGETDAGEMFTNVEEYLKTELPMTGLLKETACGAGGKIEGLTEDSCQDQIERPTRNLVDGEPSGFSDSDYFFWDELAHPNWT